MNDCEFNKYINYESSSSEYVAGEVVWQTSARYSRSTLRHFFAILLLRPDFFSMLVSYWFWPMSELIVPVSIFCTQWMKFDLKISQCQAKLGVGSYKPWTHFPFAPGTSQITQSHPEWFSTNTRSWLVLSLNVHNSTMHTGRLSIWVNYMQKFNWSLKSILHKNRRVAFMLTWYNFIDSMEDLILDLYLRDWCFSSDNHNKFISTFAPG